MMKEDTICAISTPPGLGAIAVIRLSGPEAVPITNRVFKGTDLEKAKTHTAHFGRIMDGDHIVDEVVVTLFKGPKSYTGDDIVEISCHGSPYIQQRVLELLHKQGARYANPGEFTQRAFLNGKLDLVQAESVADLIAADSPAAHDLAMKQMRGGFSQEIKNLREKLIEFASLIELELDFSEEDVEFANRDDLVKTVEQLRTVIKGLIESFQYGNVMKKGVPVAIVGRPNAGKSTLLNALLKEERAIVSEIAGTTRDVIEDELIIDGISYRFIDTAGIREATDEIERVGIDRTYAKISEAMIVLLVVDRIDLEDENLRLDVEKLRFSLSKEQKLVVLVNKVDDGDASTMFLTGLETLVISAKTGRGIDELKQRLVEMVTSGEAGANDMVVTNARHLQEFEQTYEALSRVIQGMKEGVTSDFIAMDIRQAVHHLGQLTGEITTDDLLDNIFSNFCIGK